MCQEPRRTSQALKHSYVVFLREVLGPECIGVNTAPPRALTPSSPHLPSALIPSPSLLFSPLPALVNIVNNVWGILGPRSHSPPGSERSPDAAVRSAGRGWGCEGAVTPPGFRDLSSLHAGPCATGCGSISQNIDMGWRCWRGSTLSLIGSPAEIQAVHPRVPPIPLLRIRALACDLSCNPIRGWSPGKRGQARPFR